MRSGARRVQVSSRVVPVILEMDDGTEYRWALDLRAVAALTAEHDDALDYLRSVLTEYADDMLAQYYLVLSIGLIGAYPDMTPERAREVFPESLPIYTALMQALAQGLPTADRPT